MKAAHAIFLAVGLVLSLQTAAHAQYVQSAEGLRDLNIETLYRAEGVGFVPRLYQNLVQVFSAGGASPRVGDLEAMFEFKHRLEQEMDWLDGANSNAEVMHYFDGALAQILRTGLADGRYDLLSLNLFARTHDISFFSYQKPFAKFVIEDYLRQRERNSQVLIEARDFLGILFVKYSSEVQRLHSFYRDDFWNLLYQSEQRALMIQSMGDGVASFQEPHSIVVAGAVLFDDETKLIYLDRIIQTSQDPQEIMKAMTGVWVRRWTIFPRYSYYDGSIHIPTQHLSPFQRARVFLRHEAKEFLPGILLAPIWIPIYLSFRHFNPESADHRARRQEAQRFRAEFWKLSLKAWSRIRELAPHSQHEVLRRQFREAARLSESRALLARCGNFVRKLI